MWKVSSEGWKRWELGQEGPGSAVQIGLGSEPLTGLLGGSAFLTDAAYLADFLHPS